MSSIYDLDGNALVDSELGFEPLIKYWYQRDEETGTFYSITHIPQIDRQGNKQYPFVYWPNYPNGGTESTSQMNSRKKFLVALNGGRFASPYGSGVTLTGLPLGTVIQNGQVLQQGADGNFTATHDAVLTINSSGELGYANPLDSATTMVSNGIVSAVTGHVPIIAEYKKIDDVITQNVPEWMAYMDNSSDAQRHVLGQYTNGDYVVISAEARNYQGTGNMTVRQMQGLCISLGMRIAFLLDGGGSMETVVGQRQLNPFYENTLGRVVPTYIVFNGTTTFGEPG